MSNTMTGWCCGQSHWPSNAGQRHLGAQAGVSGSAPVKAVRPQLQGMLLMVGSLLNSFEIKHAATLKTRVWHRYVLLECCTIRLSVSVQLKQTLCSQWEAPPLRECTVCQLCSSATLFSIGQATCD